MGGIDFLTRRVWWIICGSKRKNIKAVAWRHKIRVLASVALKSVGTLPAGAWLHTA